MDVIEPARAERTSGDFLDALGSPSACLRTLRLVVEPGAVEGIKEPEPVVSAASALAEPGPELISLDVTADGDVLPRVRIPELSRAAGFRPQELTLGFPPTGTGEYRFHLEEEAHRELGGGALGSISEPRRRL